MTCLGKTDHGLSQAYFIGGQTRVEGVRRLLRLAGTGHEGGQIMDEQIVEVAGSVGGGRRGGWGKAPELSGDASAWSDKQI